VGALPDVATRRELGRAAALLRPTGMFLLGDELVAGPAGEAGLAAAVRGLHGDLDPPGQAGHWYPCVGRQESAAGERAYEQHLGPLYYALDVGPAGASGCVHVVVLDSEENVGKGRGISDGQIAWLKEDLDRVFERRGEREHAGSAGTREVIVLLHRALWEHAGVAVDDGNWGRVEALLRGFNRKPIVSVEGMGGSGGGSDLRAPHVVGVFAGADDSGGGEYRDDGRRDNIRYLVLGPAGGEIPDLAGPAHRALALVTLNANHDASAPAAGASAVTPDPTDVTVALLSMENHPSASDGPTLLPADVVTAGERALADAVEGWTDQTAAVEVVPAPDSAAPGGDGVPPVSAAVQVRISNPLKIPISVTVRAAAVESSPPAATTQSFAGTLSPAFDESRWQVAGGEARVIEPGATGRWQVVLSHTGGLLHASRPSVELLVRWLDPRGRPWQVTLHRRLSSAAR
jgi:hypothetical protein